MIILSILCGLLLIGLGFVIWKLWTTNGELTFEKNSNRVMTKKLEGVPSIEKVEKKLLYYENLCDFRVGLWEKSYTPQRYSQARSFDIEVMIVDRCEDRVKVRILEVIEKHSRNSSMECEFERKYNGQWIKSSEIKELANSKILTREKRMSKLLDK